MFEVEYPNPYHWEWYESREGFKSFMDMIVFWFVGKRGTLLNVGCGDGLLEHLILRNNPDVQILGVDISPQAIEMCNRQIKNDRAKFIVANGFDTSLGVFDYVVCSEVIEHVDSLTLVEMINRLSSLCSQGLYLTTPDAEKTIKKNPRHFMEYGLSDILPLLQARFESVRTVFDGTSLHYLCLGKKSNG